MRTSLSAALAAAALLSSVAASAEPLAYAFDTVHTQVHASIGHMGLSNSTARLLVKEGVIRFDPADVAASSVDVTLDVATLDLGDATWKEHVSAESWLHAAAFPEIRFVSSEVRPTGEATFDIVGELTLKGTTRPVTLHATLNKAGPHPFSGTPAAGFSARATVLRSDFGISEPSPAIADEIQVRIEVEAQAKG